MALDNRGPASAESDDLPPGSGAIQADPIFIFNGDADGLCAQQILFLELGPPLLRVTGLKRDIELLGRLPADAAARPG